MMTLITNVKGYRFVTVSLFCLALAFAGCATKQDVLNVDEKVNQIRIDQRLLNTRMEKIDSVLVAGAEQDTRLRVDMRSSIEDLNTQLSQLENQIADLKQLLFQISQRGMTGTAQPVVAEQPADTTAPAGDTAAAATSSVDCRSLWDNAFKDMRRGQYDLAISGFSDYLQYCPGGDLADNSQYWIAEAYYEMDQFDRAIEEYRRLNEEYPESEKRATAFFKLGRCYEKKGDEEKAMEYYLILQNEFPGSLEYEQVKDKLANWQSSKKN